MALGTMHIWWRDYFTLPSEDISGYATVHVLCAAWTPTAFPEFRLEQQTPFVWTQWEHHNIYTAPAGACRIMMSRTSFQKQTTVNSEDSNSR